VNSGQFTIFRPAFYQRQAPRDDLFHPEKSSYPRKSRKTRKNSKHFHAANEYPTGEPPIQMQLVVLFCAFHVFRGQLLFMAVKNLAH